MSINIKNIRYDCRYFRGDIPCQPSKKFDVNCKSCKYYDKTINKILIIKLGAAGDVTRTTPILYPLKKEYPNSKIFWLTYFPELVPKHDMYSDVPGVDNILNFSLQNILYLKEIFFDIVINLDKDKEAISLTNSLSAKRKYGYSVKEGLCIPLSRQAEHKYLTGVFDEIAKKNKKSYLEEIFEICGYKFNKEKYILPIDSNFSKKWNINNKKIIVGLNTGCGNRWLSRLWKDKYWIELINKLYKNKYEVILLGGKQEDFKNKLFRKETKAKYFGTYELKTFINLVNCCDIIVTQVTMALHIAIGLNKKVVLINNIFNPNEFELYNNGIIIQPSLECKCFYSPTCINKEYKCLDYLLPKDVFDKIKLLSKNI